MFRVAMSLLGTEVFALEFGEPTEQPAHDPGTTASQVELAGEVPLGFHVPPLPSVLD